MKILIVDDEKTTQTLMQRLLALRGHITVVCDAPMTIAMIEQEAPDLCILDVLMEPSGIELVRAIRARGLQTCVVLLSGMPREEVERMAGESLTSLGADGFLPKPGFTEKFSMGLEGLLQRCRSRPKKG